jgi:protein-L-isoaspartate(D-aspartate) O-methyltransferase
MSQLNIETARFNMIEQQIRPWDVLDQSTLDTVALVRREAFVPEAYRNLAFMDMEIPLNVNGQTTGESMFEPKMEARLLQELALRPADQVLEVGAGSGYMAALMAHRAQSVVTYERLPVLAEFARANLARNQCANVKVVQGDGFTARGTFQAIALSGAVASLPTQLLELLAIGGRMAAIVGTAPVMSAVLVTRLGETEFDTVKLFETLVKPLVGGPQAEKFKF